MRYECVYQRCVLCVCVYYIHVGFTVSGLGKDVYIYNSDIYIYIYIYIPSLPHPAPFVCVCVCARARVSVCVCHCVRLLVPPTVGDDAAPLHC